MKQQGFLKKEYIRIYSQNNQQNTKNQSFQASDLRPKSHSHHQGRDPQFENKISALQQDNSYLKKNIHSFKSILINKNTKIFSQEKKINQLQKYLTQNSNQSQIISVQKYQEKLSQSIQENKELSTSYENFKKNYKFLRYQKISSYARELQNENIRLVNQIKKLSEEQSTFQFTDIDYFKNQCAYQERENNILQKQNDTLTRQNKSLQLKIDSLNEMMKEFQDQMEQYKRSKILQIKEQKIKELYEQLEEKDIQNQNIYNNLVNKMEEIKQLQSQNQYLQQEKAYYAEIEQNNEELTLKNIHLQETVTNLQKSENQPQENENQSPLHQEQKPKRQYPFYRYDIPSYEIQPILYLIRYNLLKYKIEFDSLHDIFSTEDNFYLDDLVDTFVVQPFKLNEQDAHKFSIYILDKQEFLSKNQLIQILRSQVKRYNLTGLGNLYKEISKEICSDTHGLHRKWRNMGKGRYFWSDWCKLNMLDGRGEHLIIKYLEDEQQGIEQEVDIESFFSFWDSIKREKIQMN